MSKYRIIDEINDIDFVKLIVTYKDVDAKNRVDIEQICNEIGFNIENLKSNIQIHSDIVNLVDESNIGMKEEGDALITNLKNVPLLVFTADCVPIAFIDIKNKAIGVAHAGWKGTYEEISKKTIEAMIKEYKTNPKDIVCVIGPSIGPCCYEVSKELIDKFNMNFTKVSEEFCTIKEGRNMLDLWKINEYSIKKCGVNEENIINLRLCTSCENDKFHSYRLDNQTPKRIGMILEIKE